MSLDLQECPRCDGYIIPGTLKRTGMLLRSRCRCDDTEGDKRTEDELRELSANALIDKVHDELSFTVEMMKRRRAA